MIKMKGYRVYGENDDDYIPIQDEKNETCCTVFMKNMNDPFEIIKIISMLKQNTQIKTKDG